MENLRQLHPCPTSCKRAPVRIHGTNESRYRRGKGGKRKDDLENGGFPDQSVSSNRYNRFIDRMCQDRRHPINLRNRIILQYMERHVAALETLPAQLRTTPK